MNPSTKVLNASRAARLLGVSVKALRLYEQNGLLAPDRTAAGWRAYGPAEMARAREIVAFRALGLSLAQIKRVLSGDSSDLQAALGSHEAMLEQRLEQLAATIAKVRALRADLRQGALPAVGELVTMTGSPRGPAVAFALPWPWGGEPFELPDIRALTFITGPLGSGKTRLAQRLAETLPGAAFIGLERLDDAGAAARARREADAALASRVAQALAWLIGDGAEASDALVALATALEAEGPDILVIDMVEQGLNHAAQQALIAYLRHRTANRRPLFLLTRSSSILDPAAMGRDEQILFCPANHGAPRLVAPHASAPGYESVLSCLASPAVRARTAGVIAFRPKVAAMREYPSEFTCESG